MDGWTDGWMEVGMDEWMRDGETKVKDWRR